MVTTLMELAGAGLLVAAAAWLSIPLALAVAGVLLLAGSWLIERRT